MLAPASNRISHRSAEPTWCNARKSAVFVAGSSMPRGSSVPPLCFVASPMLQGFTGSLDFGLGCKRTVGPDELQGLAKKGCKEVRCAGCRKNGPWSKGAV